MKHSIIAMDAGIAPETLSRILSARHARPAFETVVRIVHATGHTVGWLLAEHGYTFAADDVRQLRKAAGIIAAATADVQNKTIERADGGDRNRKRFTAGRSLETVVSYPRRMRTTATLLASLDSITHEALVILTALDTSEGLRRENVREARHRIEEIRTKAQELLDLISEQWLEEATN